MSSFEFFSLVCVCVCVKVKKKRRFVWNSNRKSGKKKRNRRSLLKLFRQPISESNGKITHRFEESKMRIIEMKTKHVKIFWEFFRNLKLRERGPRFFWTVYKQIDFRKRRRHRSCLFFVASALFDSGWRTQKPFEAFDWAVGGVFFCFFWVFLNDYNPKYPPMVEAKMTPNTAKQIMIIIFFCK